MTVLTNLNLSKNEIQNAVVQPLAVAPSNPKLGQIYYNSNDKLLYHYNGTEWVAVGSPYELPIATETTLGGVTVDNDTINVDASGKLSLGDIPDATTNAQTPTFSQAGTRTNISSGETLSTLFGKISKWFADLGSLAFKSTVAKTDLSSDVQASLDKADTALQVAPVTSVNSKTGAVSLSASDVGALSTQGGTVTGGINMSTNKITGLGAGSANTDAVNKKQLDDAISGLGTVFNLKGAKATIADLPQSGNRIGDVWFVEEVSAAYIWLTDTTSPDGRWEEFGEPIDLSGYLTKSGLAQTVGTATDNTMSQNAIKTELDKKANISDLPSVIQVATGTISTSAKTVTVSYTGTVLSTYVKDASGNEVIVDVAINASNVVFTTASNPTSALTCTVVYK